MHLDISPISRPFCEKCRHSEVRDGELEAGVAITAITQSLTVRTVHTLALPSDSLKKNINRE